MISYVQYDRRALVMYQLLHNKDIGRKPTDHRSASSEMLESGVDTSSMPILDQHQLRANRLSN